MAILGLGMALFPLGLLAAPYADYVIDARTGEVLHQTNADTRLHPASLTKMMTLYICFEAIEHGEISLDTMVTVSKFAASQPPSRLGLRAGQKIALRYLIRAAAVKSANDAAAAIGDAIEGNKDAFARRMNRTAQAMGMTRTTFKNPNGLTEAGHMSTAHDMTILGRHLFYDFPQYYNIFSRRAADAGVAQVASTNRRFLDAYDGADGIKTGYTAPAGFNLVASAQRGDVRIIATVFGGTSTAMRNSRAAELLDMGFQKAPSRVNVQKPALIAYQGNIADKTQVAQADTPTDLSTDEPGVDDVAVAIASDVGSGSLAPAKTLRLQLAVNQSPVPHTRGGGASTAVASAAPDPADQDRTIAAQATDMASATDAVMASMQDTIKEALAEAQAPTGPTFVQTTKPQPETLALADAPADAAAVAAPAVTSKADTAAPVSSLLPQTRPAVTTDDSAPVQVASADDAPESTDAAAPVVEEASILPVDATPDTPRLTAKLVGVADGAGVRLAPAPRPAEKPQPQEIVLTAAKIEPTAPAAAQQVVTRVSTSGGREWGINVGTFTTRDRAERQLLHTALAEMSTLSDSLRKVVQQHGGFEADFVGMTQDSATLACNRIAARGTGCKVINPGA